MATCKDCIHHDICDAKGNLILTINDICELEYRTDVSEWWCKHFKLTADVVPKSEVEEAVKKVVGATDKVICEAKAEVARDILEMVEGFMCLYEREHRPFNSSEYVTYYDIKLRDAVIGWIEKTYDVSPRFRKKEGEQ